MRDEILKRLRSKVVWLGIISQVAAIITLIKPDISDTFKAVAIPLLEIFTLFGLLNNPGDKENF